MMSKLISEQTNRQTGTTIQLLDNRDEPLDYQQADGRYETVCKDHGGVMGYATKSAALRFSSVPVEWCEGCQRAMAVNGASDRPAWPEYLDAKYGGQ